MLQQAAPQLAAGSVAAIGLNDAQQERLAALVSIPSTVAQDLSALRHLVQSMKSAIARATGIDAEIIFIAERLPLTSSGKMARAQAKSAYLANQFTVIHNDEESL